MTAPRVQRLRVRGLRGYPDDVVFNLDGKSLCLLAENGQGKTTLADAFEFWGTGDIAGRFHREGCALTSAIHVDADRAEVELTVAGLGAQTRSLTAIGPCELEPAASALTARRPEPVPVLRHYTITDFMDCTAGEKKKALLALVGLNALNDLRDPLRRAAGHAKRTADESRRALARERAAVASQLAGAELVAYAEQRRLSAGLTATVTCPADILALSLAKPARSPHSNAAVLVDALAAALAALGPDPGDAYNREVADEATVRAAGMAALLEAARHIIGPETDSCPVCEQRVLGADLARRLAQRAAELDATQARLAATKDALARFIGQVDDVRRALEAVLATAPAGGWAHAQLLSRATEALRSYLDRARHALDDTRAVDGRPDLAELVATLSEIRSAAEESMADDPTRALIELAELRQKCLRLDDAQRRRHAAEEVERATARMLEIADEEIERAITSTIERLGARAADLYARLVRGAPHTDVKLVYRPARSGQVEFSLTFDGRHTDVSPPQRIMSTSQLNALGLALMLARLLEEPCAWRTLVLDDVVNAFDATHRQGLARLLADEFADWQVVVLTHDRAFREILRSVTKQWRFQEVVAFSPRSGPVFNDADPRVELRRRLVEDGATAMEVAHLARRALEQGLWRPLFKLRFPTLHFDPEQRYGARDYLHALRRGFKHANSPLKDLRVLARMEADSYMVNLGVHDRFDAAALSTDDLLRLADDLDELDAALHCQGCGAPIWRQDGGAGMHCACGTLKLAA